MDLTPILVAVIASTASVLTALVTTGRMRRKEPGKSSLTVLRERVELAEAREAVWHEKFDTETAAHAVTKGERDFARQSSDECARRLADVYADMARGRHLVDRRPEPRTPRGS